MPAGGRRSSASRETAGRGSAASTRCLAVDVAAPEFRALHLIGEVAQGATGPRAEVEYPLALNGPVVGKQPHDLALGLRTELQIGGTGTAPPVDGVHPQGERPWRQRQVR
jgi:hypothetical protein